MNQKYIFYKGLGPLFKINCQLENLGKVPLKEVSITYLFNDRIFQIINSPHKIEYLIPNIYQNFVISIRNIDE